MNIVDIWQYIWKPHVPWINTFKRLFVSEQLHFHNVSLKAQIILIVSDKVRYKMVENASLLDKMYIFSVTGLDAQVKAIFSVYFNVFQ